MFKQAIAKFLNCVESDIKRLEEWAKVFFVIVKGSRPKFVSKKVVQHNDIKVGDAVTYNHKVYEVVKVLPGSVIIREHGFTSAGNYRGSNDWIKPKSEVQKTTNPEHLKMLDSQRDRYIRRATNAKPQRKAGLQVLIKGKQIGILVTGETDSKGQLTVKVGDKAIACYPEEIQPYNGLKAA